MKALQKIFGNSDLLLGAGMLTVVSMLIIPLPHWALDVGLVGAMAAAVLIMLTAVNVEEPLQFSVFPSLLLVTTLFRVALSIAATKLILGSGDAGAVIQTFGEFVLGGNFVVGFVSFVILMIVQYIVITQGATRVSEVVARFTLDAMPGKQMAIDADLASGLIDEDQARARRKEVKQEADFYGAMDGASKFVKGDAIASVLITIVNIIGGFAIGFSRGEGDALSILSTYTLLSVGEGLVSAIPAVLISTASGLLVTRNGQEASMGGTVLAQFLRQHRIMGAAGIALAVFGFIPGFPTLIFLAVGGGLFAVSRMVQKNPELIPQEKKPEEEKTPEPTAAPTGPDAVLPLVSVDALEIELGYGLTKLADPRVGGDLTDRVSATRRQLALDLGYVMPAVRIRDDATLPPKEYVVKVRGEVVARSQVEPDALLAIDGGTVITPVAGTPLVEPVFGLDALWIDPKIRDMAERQGYTCIEGSAMIGTHLGEIVKRHAAEILTREDVNRLLDNMKQSNETVVGELIPDRVRIGDVQKVLQHLLREGVPIRDLVTVLETIADYGDRVKEPEQLGELVRAAMARTLTRQHQTDDGKVHCIALDGEAIQALQDGLQQTAGGIQIALPLDQQKHLVEGISSAQQDAANRGLEPVLIAPTQIRLGLRRMVEGRIPSLPVLAYNEVSEQAEVEFVGHVELGSAPTEAMAA